MKKKILKVLVPILVILVAIIYLLPQKEKRYVRKNIHSKEAQRDVEAMNMALKIMREKDCSDPTSWYYQGAIHWVPDTIKNNKLCESYHNIADLKDGWDNCTHTPSKKEELHFLVWHRMYIYHFEKIVRKLSGYEDFALPYWGYTNKNIEDKRLQQVLMDPSSSLFEVARFDSLNMGFPVSGEGERALDLTKLFSYNNYEMFCKNIDAAPHGAMHDYIGAGNDTSSVPRFPNKITGTLTGTGLMGWVPTAAFDPIFWTHHSNIDRIWQQWSNSPNGKAVTLEILKDAPWPYIFFDENGKKVEYKIEEVLDIIYSMDYDFDDTKLQKPSSESKVMVKSKTPLLSLPKHKLNSHHNIVKLNTGSAVKGSTIFVTVSFDKVPKGAYELYLNSDKGDRSHPSDESFLGFMTFFGADHKMSGETCEKGCCGKLNPDGRNTKVFSFGAGKSVNGDLNLTILKFNKKVHKDLVIEKVEIH